MVEGKVVLRLIDFGLSANSNLPITKCSGTLEYMAPEVHNSSERTNADPVMADVFSLGATILYLVTGQLPLSLPNERNVLHSKVYQARVYLNVDNDLYSWETLEL